VGRHVSTELRHRLRIPMYKTQEGCTGKGAGPTHGFAASPEVGPGATVITLKTGYPRVQASSQRRKAIWAHMLACPATPIPWHKAAPEPPRASWWQLPPPGPMAAPGPPHARLSCGSHPLAQDSSGAATCLVAAAPATRARGSSERATCPMTLAPVS
jgi:hypothetical protein